MFPAGDTRQGLKRNREEEDWSECQDQSRHEEKKLRPLPFRTSPNTKHVIPFAPHKRPPRSVPSTLTPVESSEDEDPDLTSDNHTQETSSQANSASSLEVRVEDDEDMEMVDSQSNNPLSPVIPWMTVSGGSPTAQRSSPHLSLSVSGGRIATPIYGHFGTDVAMDTIDDPRAYFSQGSSGGDEHTWWKKRRLPSPISESEDAAMLSPKSTKSRLGSLSLQPPNQVDGSSSELLKTNPQSPANRRESGGTHSRKGSYDPRTGITTTFSMGYRADCDKCILKVPGHYAHIIREMTGTPEGDAQGTWRHGMV